MITKEQNNNTDIPEVRVLRNEINSIIDCKLDSFSRKITYACCLFCGIGMAALIAYLNQIWL